MTGYIMGRTAAEARRLRLQGEWYAPHTEHLLGLAGVSPGMRVVDVGCGVGDVTLQLARIVGPAGQVIGVDLDDDALAMARVRAAAAGLPHVSFARACIPDIPVDEPVDAIVGRLILMHLDDPVAAVRALRPLVRPGGVVSFQEIDIVYATSSRAAPLAARCMRWCAEAASAAGHPMSGRELTTIFEEAGLAVTGTSVAIPAGTDPDSSSYALHAETVASLLPVIVAHDVATEAEVDIDTLADRLRAEARERDSVLYMPELIGAWGHFLPTTVDG